LFERRISELKEEHSAAQLKLTKIELKTKSLENFVDIKQVESEKKVLLRTKSDTRIRIRNLERDLLNCSSRSSSRKNSVSFNETNININDTVCDKFCDKERNQSVQESELIDFEDEYFDPSQTEFVHERPYPRLCPSRALPHSAMRWKYGSRVGLWKENFVLGMNTTLNDNGQFTSVEDYVDWDNMTVEVDNCATSSSPTKHKYRNKLIPAEKMTIIKPKLEKLVESRKPNIFQLVRKLSEAENCICSRHLKPIICSGGCDYSFTGRLKITCPSHPGDQYLMDHSPLCPQCNESLVEKPNEKSAIFCSPVFARKSRSKRLSSTATTSP